MATENKDVKTITLTELQEHVVQEDIYALIHGKVYNVTKFIDEHPGGEEVILAEAGKDATEAFEDVGHSDEARDILKTLFIGDFEGGEVTQKIAPSPPKISQNKSHTSFPIASFAPLVLLGAYFAWRFYYTS